MSVSVKRKLTHFKLRGEAAAGDSQVMGILVRVQEADVHVPQFEVSVGAAGHEHLATGRETAGRDAGLAHCDAALRGNGWTG